MLGPFLFRIPCPNEWCSSSPFLIMSWDRELVIQCVIEISGADSIHNGYIQDDSVKAWRGKLHCKFTDESLCESLEFPDSLPTITYTRQSVMSVPWELISTFCKSRPWTSRAVSGESIWSMAASFVKIRRTKPRTLINVHFNLKLHNLVLSKQKENSTSRLLILITDHLFTLTIENPQRFARLLT